MIRFESGETAWRRFAMSFTATVVLLGLAAIGFVAWLDPYGLRVGAGRAPSPIMDKSQRFQAILVLTKQFKLIFQLMKNRKILL